jgi:hypothetical protein
MGFRSLFLAISLESATKYQTVNFGAKAIPRLGRVVIYKEVKNSYIWSILLIRNKTGNIAFEDLLIRENDLCPMKK